MVPGVDVEERHRDRGWAKGFLRQAQQTDGIFAAGKEQRGAIKFRRHFAHDVNGFGFEKLKVVDVVAVHQMNVVKLFADEENLN